MELIPKELAQRLPPLYATDISSDPMVQCKFFFPDSHCSWYGIEFDGRDTFFGLFDGDSLVLGYFSLKELVNATSPLRMPLARDRFFVPCPLSALYKSLGR